MLNMDTYLQTAVTTQETHVLVLEMRHFERLLLRRHPQTIDAMKATLELRLSSRCSSPHILGHVPLLQNIIHQLHKYNEFKRYQKEIRQLNSGSKNVITENKIGETDKEFIPRHGALIDIFGPGTVFYHIRQRNQKHRNVRNRTAHLMTTINNSQQVKTPTDCEASVEKNNNFLEIYERPETATTRLEKKLYLWIESTCHERPTLYPTKIFHLRRLKTNQIQY